MNDDSSKNVPHLSENKPSVTLTNSQLNSTVLLATAAVEVKNAYGNYQTCRALCDTGSQCSLITERCFWRLGLTSMKSSNNLVGLNQIAIPSFTATTTCKLRPIGCPDAEITLELIILDNIHSNLPNVSIDSSRFKTLRNLKLADPNWNTPAPY